jgi:hypothetical protein
MHPHNIPSPSLTKSTNCTDFPLSFLASTAGREKGKNKQSAREEEA